MIALVGEGIIALCKSVATICEYKDSMTGPLVGKVVSSFSIIVTSHYLHLFFSNRADSRSVLST